MLLPILRTFLGDLVGRFVAPDLYYTRIQISWISGISGFTSKFTASLPTLHYFHLPYLNVGTSTSTSTSTGNSTSTSTSASASASASTNTSASTSHRTSTGASTRASTSTAVCWRVSCQS